MVAKKKITDEKKEMKGKVKVGKLKLNKETVKDLTGSEARQVKGGAGKRENTDACEPTSIMACSGDGVC